MSFDSHKNFAYSAVVAAPNPSDTGVSLTVRAGEGALFPTPPFNAVGWPADRIPLVSNAEIVRVTAIADDVFTITRHQEGSTAQNIAVGYQIAASLTAKTITDIESAVLALQAVTVNGHPLSGAVTVTKGDVGLGNADNTDDATKQLAFLQAAYPVGSIYINASSSTNPGTLLGFGTWAAFGAGQTLFGKAPSGTFSTIGATGGAETHWHWQTFGTDPTGYAEVAGAGSGRTRVITVNRATFGASGSGVAGSREDGTYDASSLPPYVVVYMWQRTA